MSKVVLIETIHDNPEWGKFLDALENQYQRDLAGAVMNWIMETYPHFADELKGELIAEITKEENLGE